MIISVETGKVFSKTQYSSVIENYEKNQEGSYLNIIKDMYNKPTINTIMS